MHLRRSQNMSLPRIVIVDYGTGNLNSVKRTLDRLRVTCVVSPHARDIADADKIILPGVGHFGRAMLRLKELGLVDALNEAVLDRRTPILGICLGMEVMAKASEEGDTPGLGWLDAEAVRFKISDTGRYKVPHMGWNEVRIKKDSRLMAGVSELSEFYFAHSYHLRINDPSDLLNETEYEAPFPSAVEKGNVFGVQYHPEKSHDAGSQVLKNFIEM